MGVTYSCDICGKVFYECDIKFIVTPFESGFTYVDDYGNSYGKTRYICMRCYKKTFFSKKQEKQSCWIIVKIVYIMNYVKYYIEKIR